MKTCWAGLIGLLLFVPAALYASDCSTTAGGTIVEVPAPERGFTEAGSDKRSLFDYMVPSGNRLLCAFVTAELQPKLKNPATGLGRYTMVEVSRGLDESNVDVTPTSFEQIVSTIKQQLGDSAEINRTAQVMSQEVTRKLESTKKSKAVVIDQPLLLGTIFQKRDMYAFAMVAPVSSGALKVRVINVSILLRIRNRLVFAYVYADADDDTSLKWTEETAENWSKRILAANSR